MSTHKTPATLLARANAVVAANEHNRDDAIVARVSHDATALSRVICATRARKKADEDEREYYAGVIYPAAVTIFTGNDEHFRVKSAKEDASDAATAALDGKTYDAFYFALKASIGDFERSVGLY